VVTREATLRARADSNEATARQNADALLVLISELCSRWAACDLSFLPTADPGNGMPWLDGTHIAVGTSSSSVVGIGKEDGTGRWGLETALARGRGGEHWLTLKISAGADPGTLAADDKLPLARSASTTAYAATMAEIASYANTAYTPNYSAAPPIMDGTAAPGVAAAVSRGDHIHPSDLTRAPLASPTFTGTPAAPTATAGTNSTQIATTAYVLNAVTGGTAAAIPGASYADNGGLHHQPEGLYERCRAHRRELWPRPMEGRRGWRDIHVRRTIRAVHQHHHHRRHIAADHRRWRARWRHLHAVMDRHRAGAHRRRVVCCLASQRQRYSRSQTPPSSSTPAHCRK
jgi:hypothetical protein